MMMPGNPAKNPKTPSVGVCSLLVQAAPALSLYSPSQITVEELYLELKCWYCVYNVIHSLFTVELEGPLVALY